MKFIKNEKIRFSFLLWVLCCLLVIVSCNSFSDEKETLSTHYLQNKEPLTAKPYLELPLGSIQPKSWFKEQLERMTEGMTGNLDEIYPEVVSSRNGWLGGDGDGWERGPYWIDGLLPLAYILDDEKLKAKVKPWIEWTLNNQAENGYLGPIPFEEEPEYEPGLQRGQRKDWWPKMVMLKILQQYYGATGDERVIKALTQYFKYQLKELPNRPLDDQTFWANRRGGDNLMVVYWLYNITGDEFLLDLSDTIQEQTFPWTSVFQNPTWKNDSIKPYHYFKMKGFPFDSTEIKNLRLSQTGSIHTVNLAQGLKEPVIRYQKDHNPEYIDAVKNAIENIKKYHGQPQGMYGGDEPLHGKNPVQGVEFCSISEEMFSLETILQITGDAQFADHLEKIAYNALPTQASDDFTSRQYFQAANQVALTDNLKTSFETEGHKGTDFVFGTLTGYPCCTTNMHQSWPKYVQNLFYATPDGGAAALLYAPSSVKMKVADNVDLRITETTGYPFREEVKFEFNLSEKASFPFHLRIPSWTEGAEIYINGEKVNPVIDNNIAILKREWSNGDSIRLKMPMQIKTSSWFQNSTTIERGPLIYALKIRGEEKKKDRGDGYGKFTEVFPKDHWNYAISQTEINNIPQSIEIIENEWNGGYPWNLENSPISLKMKAVKSPEWELVDDAPEFSEDITKGLEKTNLEMEEIILIPYGCTTLRITEFPTFTDDN